MKPDPILEDLKDTLSPEDKLLLAYLNEVRGSVRKVLYAMGSKAALSADPTLNDPVLRKLRSHSPENLSAVTAELAKQYLVPQLESFSRRVATHFSGVSQKNTPVTPPSATGTDDLLAMLT